MVEDKKKKEGVVEKSGEVVGEVAQKGASVIRGFGKGVMKGFKKKDDEEKAEKKEE